MISTLNLREVLKRHMRKKKLTQAEVAAVVELSQFTICKFLAGKTDPHKETQQNIEDFLKQEGVLTPMGHLVEPLDMQAKPDEIDKKHLESMGIMPPPPEGVRVVLSVEDKRFLTYAIIHAAGTENFKNSLLTRLGL